MSRRDGLPLSLAALGVVYGDIGTSPLYALEECFRTHHGHRIEPTPANVMGILSLIAWSLILVISVKYLLFVLRADNRGEGGILALMSLVRPAAAGRRGVRRSVLIGLDLSARAALRRRHDRPRHHHARRHRGWCASASWKTPTCRRCWSGSPVRSRSRP